MSGDAAVNRNLLTTTAPWEIFSGAWLQQVNPIAFLLRTALASFYMICISVYILVVKYACCFFAIGCIIIYHLDCTNLHLLGLVVIR